jgi:hypothetical protein
MCLMIGEPTLVDCSCKGQTRRLPTCERLSTTDVDDFKRVKLAIDYTFRVTGRYTKTVSLDLARRN